MSGPLVEVNISQFGSVESLKVPEGTKVKDIVERAVPDPDAVDVTRNSEPSDGDEEVQAGDRIDAQPRKVGHGS